MSAIEHLLTGHIAAVDLRGLAIASGVSAEDVESEYDTTRTQGWAAAYVKAAGVEGAWLAASERIKWGNRALYDFPIGDELTWSGLQSSLEPLVAARGDVFTDQAYAGLSTEPQVAFCRQLSDEIFVIIVDEIEEEHLPQLGIGMETHQVPRWTLCSLTTRGSWRLETYGDHEQSKRIAGALAQQLSLFVIGAPHNVRLDLDQVNSLADSLGGEIHARQVITHQDGTGIRKLRGEAGSAFRDIRDAPFYPQIEEVADEADSDIIWIPRDGKTYTLQVSRDGSFWFRAFTPRELIDDVLRRAEEIFGI